MTTPLTPEDVFRLCMVEGSCAWFTTDLDRVYGDDWDDAPYEHNAGSPYEWREYMGEPRYELRRVYWDGAPLVTPDEYERNSPWSVEAINRGEVAWLRPDPYIGNPTGTPAIMAGTTLPEFRRLVRQAGGQVYEASERRERVDPEPGDVGVLVPHLPFVALHREHGEERSALTGEVLDSGGYCSVDHQEWPCDAQRLLDYIAASERVDPDLRAALTAIRDMEPVPVTLPDHADCAECRDISERVRQGQWHISGMCDERYRQLSIRDRQVDSNYRAQVYRMRDIAREALAATPDHTEVGEEREMCGCTADAALGYRPVCPACGHRDHGSSGCRATPRPR